MLTSPRVAPLSGDSAEAKVSKSGYDITPLTLEARDNAAAKLTPFQQDVTLHEGTEPPFTGKCAVWQVDCDVHRDIQTSVL